MVRDRQSLMEFERAIIAADPPDYKRNFRIANWLFREAVSLRVFPLSNPLEGIETDIRVARIINSV